MKPIPAIYSCPLDFTDGRLSDETVLKLRQLIKWGKRKKKLVVIVDEKTARPNE
jgi:hypothetical protein